MCSASHQCPKTRGTTSLSTRYPQPHASFAGACRVWAGDMAHVASTGQGRCFAAEGDMKRMVCSVQPSP